MPHLDDGTLQEWLDRDRSGMSEEERRRVSEHLESCEACAARLESLEEIDDRALAILGSGVPDEIPVPEFESVLARGEQDPARASRTRPRDWGRYAWAASIVVALGVGWMANEIARDEGLSLGSPATEAETAAGAGQSGSAGGGEADADGASPGVEAAEEADLAGAADVSAETPPSPEVVPEAERAVPDGADVAAAAPDPGADASTSDDSRAAGPVAAAPAGAASARARTEEPSQADAPEQEPLAEALAADVEAAPLVVEGRVLDDQSGAPVASAQVFVPDLDVGVLTDADGSYSLTLPSRTDQSGDPVSLVVQRLGYQEASREIPREAVELFAADFRMEGTTLALEEVVATGDPGATLPEDVQTLLAGRTAGLGFQRGGGADSAAGVQLRTLADVAERLAWSSATPAEVEERLGRAPLSVPDVPVLGTEVVESEGVSWVRVRQDLGDGAVLVLLHVSDPEGALALSTEDEEGAVRIRRGDVVVEASGVIAADSLRVLLERVR